MKIFFMNGGLGNQIFQYIFMRWIELTGGEAGIIDDSAFCVPNPPHNGYELECLFGLKPQKLSQFFDADVWAYMMEQRMAGKSIPQQLLENGLPLAMVYESGEKDFTGNIFYTRADNFLLNQCSGNLYFRGYWMFTDFFAAIEPVLRQELIFPEITDEKNSCYDRAIKGTNSVALHVRRGDMVALGRCQDEQYFKDCVDFMETKVHDAHYFIFSDDLSWCRAHEKEMGLHMISDRVIFVEGNTRENAYRDLALMSHCRHNINSWSSFSFLASILNTNKDKIVLQANANYVRNP